MSFKNALAEITEISEYALALDDLIESLENAADDFAEHQPEYERMIASLNDASQIFQSIIFWK